MAPRPRRIRRAVVLVLLLAGASFGGLEYKVHDLAKENLSNGAFDRRASTDPARLGLSAEAVQFVSDDLLLSGWWVPPAASATKTPVDEAGEGAPAVILVHGYSADKGKVLRRWGVNLHEAGYGVFAFDLRNHGSSEDDPSHRVAYGATEYRDVLAAGRYVSDNAERFGVDPDRIVLYGASMGAVAVLAAAASHPPGVAAVVFDSGFASLATQAHIDGADAGYPRWVVDRVLARMEQLAPAPPPSVAPTDTIGRVTAPLLLAHCANDTRVHAANHDALRPLAPPGTRFWSGICPPGLSGEGHVDGWMLPGYNATVRNFLATALAGQT